MNYGKVIKNARKKDFLSQKSLANRVGVVRTTIAAWENEKFPPTDAKNIAALERELNFSPGALFNILMYINLIQQVPEKKTI